MKITFESSPDTFKFPFRIIGNAGRYDTISDCKFIDDQHIVCADRQMARLYLVEFDLDADTYTILDSVTCVHKGNPVHFEILTTRRFLDCTMIYAVSYTNSLFSCMIKDNKFTDFDSVVINPMDNYHGVTVLEDEESVYVTNMKTATITEFNTRTGSKRIMECAGGIRMKDVAILDSDHILALSSDRGPINGTQNTDGTVSPTNSPYNSHILVYNRRTSKRICSHTLENTQVDGCIFKSPHCYVTCTDSSGNGYILQASIDIANQTISNMVHMPCAGFPHGLDIHGDLFAYTSYSESALYICGLKNGSQILT